MSIKFYKLMDLLHRRNISKGELQKMAKFSSATMAKLSSGEYVSLEIIDKLCESLQVQPGDIMEYFAGAKQPAVKKLKQGQEAVDSDDEIIDFGIKPEVDSK